MPYSTTQSVRKLKGLLANKFFKILISAFYTNQITEISISYEEIPDKKLQCKFGANETSSEHLAEGVILQFFSKWKLDQNTGNANEDVLVSIPLGFSSEPIEIHGLFTAILIVKHESNREGDEIKIRTRAFAKSIAWICEQIPDDIHDISRNFARTDAELSKLKKALLGSLEKSPMSIWATITQNLELLRIGVLAMWKNREIDNETIVLPLIQACKAKSTKRNPIVLTLTLDGVFNNFVFSELENMNTSNTEAIYERIIKEKFSLFYNRYISEVQSLLKFSFRDNTGKSRLTTTTGLVKYCHDYFLSEKTENRPKIFFDENGKQIKIDFLKFSKIYLPTSRINTDLLFYAFSELLDNALTYSYESDDKKQNEEIETKKLPIKVSCSISNELVVIEFLSIGSKIEECIKIFNYGFREEYVVANKINSNGTGTGLYLVKKFIEEESRGESIEKPSIKAESLPSKQKYNGESPHDNKFIVTFPLSTN